MNSIILYVLIGGLAGIFMGILGMGAGVITVPLLVYAGMDIRTAVGASLLMQLLPQSIAGVWLYHKRGYIDYINSLWVIFGSFIGILFGAYIVTMDFLSEKMTYKLMTILLIIITGIFVNDHLLND